MVRTFFTPEHTDKPHRLHQSLNGGSGHPEALLLQLAPDLTNAINTVVFVLHALYLLLQMVITLVTLTAFVRV